MAARWRAVRGALLLLAILPVANSAESSCDAAAGVGAAAVRSASETATKLEVRCW